MHPLISAGRAQYLGILAVVSAVFVLVAMILLWVLYYRTRFGLYLWFAIMGCIIFVVALMVAGLSFAIKGGIAADRPEKKLFSAIIYIGSVISAVFLLGSALVLIWYKYIHFNKLLLIHDDTSTFEHRYPNGSDFDSAWKSDRRLIWWTIFFSMFGAVFLGICAFLMWSISKFMIQLARGVLAICGAIAILFMCLALYNINKAMQGPGSSAVFQEIFTPLDYNFLYYLGAIILFLLLVNLIFNVVKKRIVYFFLGILLLIFVLVFVIKAAEIMRRVRQLGGPGHKVTDRNMDIMRNIHEDSLAPYCNKYIDKACGKQWVQIYKEGDMRRRTLNPSCARAGLLGILSTLYWGCIYALLASVFAAVVIACDFYLSDTTEFLETFNRETSPFDYLGLALGIIFFLVALIWLLVAAGNFPSVKEINKQDKDLIQKLEDGTYRDNDFPTVPTKIRHAEQKISKLCTKYDNNTMVSVKDNPNCKFGKGCGYRVHILAESTQFGGLDASEIGDSSFRVKAYPKSLNSLDSFVLLKGTASEIQAQLEKLRFCPTRFGELNSIFYAFEEVDLNTLDSSGYKNNEPKFSVPTLSETGAREFPSYFNLVTNSVCTSKHCWFENRFNPSTGVTNVIVSLYAKNKDDVYKPLSDSLVKNIEAFVYHGKTEYKKIAAGSIGNKGAFAIKAPVANYAYVATLVIKHHDGLVVPIKKDFVVLSDARSRLNIGRLPIMLPDGSGCNDAADFNTCAKEHQNSKTGTLKFKVIDNDLNVPVSGVEVSLYENHVLGQKPHGSQTVQPETTDDHGYITFKNVPYDFYTAFANKIGYVLGQQHSTLEDAESFDTIYLKPEKKTAMDVTMLVDNKVSSDMDLKVKFENDQGKQCLVSSENKYCGYAQYVYDVKRGKSGTETVRVHNMTYSHYMVYTEALYNTDQTCTQYRTANKHFGQRINWNAVTSHKQSKLPKEKNDVDPNQKYWVSQCFTGFGQVSIKTLNKRYTSDPDISTCKKLFPDTDRFSLKNLRKEVKELS